MRHWRERLKRAWCWLAHRREWTRNTTLAVTVCNQCGEVW
jgi:hypothetical protein